MSFKNTIILGLAMIMATSSVSSKSSIPKVSEYYTFGENNVLVSILQANLGASVGLYKNLLWRETPQYRSDECYRDLWLLADNVISSFNVLGRGDITQIVAFGFFLLQIGISSYLSVATCYPLFLDNPPAFTPLVYSDALFYVARSFELLFDIFVTLLNADSVIFYKNLVDIGFGIEQIIRRATA
ncbi:UNKNOWN [Stylonychia lemnae]|uniref:Uncharacterized protein n=1 Tax=Stylonychia lemnae TaxID=5949 RepID=A0A078A8R7_STYLE|nr:UNKNOWN [Stylonychia lemnae]|eukprot:CDW77927.1 UNKNOWN [Stylonychia lemnae]